MPLPRQKSRRVNQTGLPRGTDPTCSDLEYSPAELEFMLAMERYRREHHRRFPTCCEVLAVVKSLGYRKADCRAAPSVGGGGETVPDSLIA